MAKFTLVKVPFIPRILGSNLVRKHTEPSVAIQSFNDLKVTVERFDRLPDEERATALKVLEADKEVLEVQFKYHNSCQDRRRKVYETRCRLQGCTGEKRKDREAAGPKKTRRGKRMFCDPHAYLRHQLTKEQYQELAGNIALRVVTT